MRHYSEHGLYQYRYLSLLGRRKNRRRKEFRDKLVGRMTENRRKRGKKGYREGRGSY